MPNSPKSGRCNPTQHSYDYGMPTRAALSFVSFCLSFSSPSCLHGPGAEANVASGPRNPRVSGRRQQRSFLLLVPGVNSLVKRRLLWNADWGCCLVLRVFFVFLFLVVLLSMVLAPVQMCRLNSEILECLVGHNSTRVLLRRLGSRSRLRDVNLSLLRKTSSG